MTTTMLTIRWKELASCYCTSGISFRIHHTRKYIYYIPTEEKAVAVVAVVVAVVGLAVLVVLVVLAPAVELLSRVL
jgi:hypothetical protein